MIKYVVIFVIIVVAINAVKTLIPSSTASKVCYLGYQATCSFAPLSTIILALSAFAIYVAANRFGIF